MTNQESYLNLLISSAEAHGWKVEVTTRETAAKRKAVSFYATRQDNVGTLGYMLYSVHIHIGSKGGLVGNHRSMGFGVERTVDLIGHNALRYATEFLSNPF